VTPYQVSGQDVATKSQSVPQATGAGGEACATAGGGAFVTMMGSADALPVHAAPAMATIAAAPTPNFFMPSPHQQQDDRSTVCAILFF
jgi:hypothetical protein